MSSACGAADVLEALGLDLELDLDDVTACIEQVGLGFLYSPKNRPAMRFVAPVRKALGVRTAFNLLGPLTNAAGAQRRGRVGAPSDEARRRRGRDRESCPRASRGRSAAPRRRHGGATAAQRPGTLAATAARRRVVIGVFDEKLVDLLAGALERIGIVEHCAVTKRRDAFSLRVGMLLNI